MCDDTPGVDNDPFGLGDDPVVYLVRVRNQNFLLQVDGNSAGEKGQRSQKKGDELHLCGGI